MEENKRQIWWCTVEYKWKLYQKTSHLNQFFLLHFFLSRPNGWTKIIENLVELVWRRVKTSDRNSNWKSLSHGVSRTNLSVFNVYVNEQTKSPLASYAYLSKTYQNIVYCIRHIGRKKMKLCVTFAKESKISFVWKFLKLIQAKSGHLQCGQKLKLLWSFFFFSDPRNMLEYALLQW